MGLRPETIARVEAAVAAAQRDWRAPNLSAGLVRDGEIVHTVHVGSACLQPRRPATDDTQWLIGSVTKTFTGVLVMQFVEQGRVELDDPISRHLPELDTHPGLTIGRMLAHAGGLQREPVGRVWETLQAPDAAQLLAGIADAEQVIDPHRAFHYSNLAYALLGQLVERVTGRDWEDVLGEQVLGPLQMTSTGLTPPEGRATGYLVDPFSGVAHEEPVMQLRATAPMGGLWSSTTDLLRYAAFLADPAPEILRPGTIEQMCRPVIMVDAAWRMAYGLSLSLVRRGERVYAGHGGAMPGYLTGLRVSRADRLGAVVWCNSGAGADPIVLAGDLLDLVLDAEPTRVPVWEPEQDHPELGPILGAWWSEGTPIVFEVRDGRLVSHIPGAGEHMRSRYVRLDDDTYRVDEGRELGERLEIERAADGSVTRMHLATYAVTREPLPFASLS